jgi:hypothetical protein
LGIWCDTPRGLISALNRYAEAASQIPALRLGQPAHTAARTEPVESRRYFDILPSDVRCSVVRDIDQ